MGSREAPRRLIFKLVAADPIPHNSPQILRTETPMEKRMDSSSGSVTGLHHLAFRASDFDGTVKFYTDGLGCRETTRWGQAPSRAVMLDTGNGSHVEIFEGG